MAVPDRWFLTSSRDLKVNTSRRSVFRGAARNNFFVPFWISDVWFQRMQPLSNVTWQNTFSNTIHRNSRIITKWYCTFTLNFFLYLMHATINVIRVCQIYWPLQWLQRWLFPMLPNLSLQWGKREVWVNESFNTGNLRLEWNVSVGIYGCGLKGRARMQTDKK